MWHALGRVPLQGRLWYYSRWILVSIVGGLWLIAAGTLSQGAGSVGPATPPRVVDVVATVGIFVLCGVGLAHYAERLNSHGTRRQKHVLVRAVVKILIAFSSASLSRCCIRDKQRTATQDGSLGSARPQSLNLMDHVENSNNWMASIDDGRNWAV